MLISWYMAGYHTGFYQATKTTAAATPAAASSSPPQPPLLAAAAAPNPFSSLPPVGAKASTVSSQQHRASFQSVAPQPAAADLASQKSTTNKTMKRKKTWTVMMNEQLTINLGLLVVATWSRDRINTHVYLKTTCLLTNSSYKLKASTTTVT